MAKPFKLFGNSHLVGVISSLAIVYLTLKKLAKLPREKQERIVNPLLGWTLLAWTVISRLILIAQGDFHWEYDLPFHLCSISTVLLGIYFLRPNQKFFDVLFYWALSGGILALIFPDLKVDFPSFRYFSMFIGHVLLLFSVLYLHLLQGMNPGDSGTRAFKWINALILPLIPVNLVTGGNYLFLHRIPEIDFGPVSWLPSWPWYLLVLDLFVLALFRFWHYLFMLEQVWFGLEVGREPVQSEKRA